MTAPADQPKSPLIDAIRGMIGDLGALIVFWALNLTAGTKPAIAGAILFIIGDGLRRWMTGEAFSRLAIFSGLLTIAFGAIDLLSDGPFMLKYEPAVSSTAMGLAFFIGARGAKSMIQEVVERRRGAPFVDRPDLVRFFRIMTNAWAGFFLLRAIGYVVLARSLALGDVLLVRSTVGTVSLLVMIALTVTLTRPLYRLCQWLKLLPPQPRREESQNDRGGLSTSL
jgi:intracellular septation protein A